MAPPHAIVVSLDEPARHFGRPIGDSVTLRAMTGDGRMQGDLALRGGVHAEESFIDWPDEARAALGN